MDPSTARLLDLSGQVALATGASQGIGEAIARVLHGAGAHVALLARSQDRLAALAAELRQSRPNAPGALAIPTDVADPGQVDGAVGQVLETWGQIDILVNNAGIIRAGPYTEIDLAEWQRLLDVNLTGAYACVRAVAPHMEARGYGRIVNISSITAQTGGASGGVHYAAAKGGLLSMTKTLARDLAPHGITVNAIAPGQIDTRPDLLTPEERRRLEALIPLGRLGRPEEIAYGVLFLVSPMAAYITGATLDVNGGILKR